ncbi:hypothetical protein [Sinobaca sp. H24]|uniref:hypothetical protein n=1 Tax=Sinobaca sp. H24 TaxID=2923376 RepID=UPI00207AF6D8|nr:hypothetical protein [Sinobaca sp. H24]
MRSFTVKQIDESTSKNQALIKAVSRASFYPEEEMKRTRPRDPEEAYYLKKFESERNLK